MNELAVHESLIYFNFFHKLIIEVFEFIVLVKETEYINISITWFVIYMKQTPTTTCHLDIRIKFIPLNLTSRCHHIFCIWFNSNVTYPHGTDNLTKKFVSLQDYLEVLGLLDASSSVCLVGCSFGLRGVLSPDSLKKYIRQTSKSSLVKALRIIK